MDCVVLFVFCATFNTHFVYTEDAVVFEFVLARFCGISFILCVQKCSDCMSPTKSDEKLVQNQPF